MKLDVISYSDILNSSAQENIVFALLNKGIVGISDVPSFENKTRSYINAARAFSNLEESIKQQYAPLRETGDTDGYEQGAEQFKNAEGIWQADDKKVSYYAHVPDKLINKWPREVDLKTSYLELGELIFKTGKILLNAIGLNHLAGLNHDLLSGYGRMLHYRKENDDTNNNPNWCGEHFDHGIFTGLVPAYYFRNGCEIEEPEEAGLYIKPPMSDQFEKIDTVNKSVLLFQAGEFGQHKKNN
jgi:isopenicillin N synthase-like dioxygenase